MQSNLFFPGACLNSQVAMATVGQLDGAMRRITVHYAHPPPAHGAEEPNFHGADSDCLEFVIVDVLQDQEGLYQSILDGTYNNHNGDARTTTPIDNPHYCYYHGESSGTAATDSRTSDVHEQIASDFEYARQLQAEMEDLAIETTPDEEDDISCVPSPSDTDDDGDGEQEAARQDDDDDDQENTYEQRLALVESVGNEGRGLSDLLISYLVPRKYKSGFFSRKTNHENCPICLSTFRNRERLITLPCKHNYHANCVARWLKIDKTCPLCKYEVFGPS